jgi:phytoene dehydrogenase-like protein
MSESKLSQAAARSADAIVVGGGLAGLLAAARLAKAGLAVHVFEQAGHLGGRAATNDFHGVRFNLGPHALYATGHACRLLKELEVPIAGRFPSPGRPLVTLGGKSYRLPAGLGSLATSRLLSVSEKLRLARLFGSIKTIDTRQLDNTSAREWIEGVAGRGNLALLLAALFRVSTYVDDAERLSAGMALDQLRTALVGNVLYLDGGWQSIVDALRHVAIAHGATVQTQKRVQSIDSDGLHVTAHLASGEQRQARTAILAVEPDVACRLLGAPADAPLARWTGRQIAVPAACLDVALNALPRPNDRFALGLDQPLYYSVHSAAAQLGPTGVHVLHVMKYARADRDEPAAKVEAELETMLDQLQPGWRAHLVARRFLPKMTVAQALPVAVNGGGQGRATVDAADQPNVFLAGDWVGPDAMLADAAAASAAHAAERVLAIARTNVATNDREHVLYARG